VECDSNVGVVLTLEKDSGRESTSPRPALSLSLYSLVPIHPTQRSNFKLPYAERSRERVRVGSSGDIALCYYYMLGQVRARGTRAHDGILPTEAT